MTFTKHCDYCRAGWPKGRYEFGKGFVKTQSGNTHFIERKFKGIELVACKAPRDHECDFEQFEFCNARVCVQCGEHPGVNICKFCGWRRNELPVQTELQEEVTIEQVLFG